MAPTITTPPPISATKFTAQNDAIPAAIARNTIEPVKLKKQDAIVNCADYDYLKNDNNQIISKKQVLYTSTQDWDKKLLQEYGFAAKTNPFVIGCGRFSFDPKVADGIVSYGPKDSPDTPKANNLFYYA